jgi:hypothetical protein
MSMAAPMASSRASISSPEFRESRVTSRSGRFWPMASVALGLGLTVAWASFLAYEIYDLASLAF